MPIKSFEVSRTEKGEVFRIADQTLEGLEIISQQLAEMMEEQGECSLAFKNVELQQLPLAAAQLAPNNVAKIIEAADPDFVDLVKKARAYLDALFNEAQVRFNKELH